MVSINPRNLYDLRMKYREAVLSGATSLCFQGETLSTTRADYLIRLAESKIYGKPLV